MPPVSAPTSQDMFPTDEAFLKNYNLKKSQLAWSRHVSDLETPISAYLKLCNEQKNCFLLESVEGGATRGRYSIIGLQPDLIWRANGQTAEIKENPEKQNAQFKTQDQPALISLRQLLKDSQMDIPEGLPPMAAGVFGFMSYDTVRLVEHLPNVNKDDLDLPESILLRPSILIIFDSVIDEIFIITPVRYHKSIKADEALTKAKLRIENIIAKFYEPLPQGTFLDQAFVDEFDKEPTSNMSPKAYQNIVKEAKEHIAAGDIFQIVLSQRFEAPYSLPPFSLYRALRRTNPSPYLYFIDFGDFTIAGSSPEILVKAHDKKVTIRPIAGTRRRGKTSAEDQALAKELLSDPKERSEHLMLLDLGRNDVGRVAKEGTVTVTDQFFLEYYSHVMHIVSNVEGNLSDTYDEIDALMAGFPAGTVSGAPKVRAMELIDKFEVTKRGIYAGCVGYFSAGGNMDSCIILRTAVIKDNVMYVQAGAGIVADSDPVKEHEECVNKAKALFKARNEALRFAIKQTNHRS